MTARFFAWVVMSMFIGTLLWVFWPLLLFLAPIAAFVWAAIVLGEPRRP